MSSPKHAQDFADAMGRAEYHRKRSVTLEDYPGWLATNHTLLAIDSRLEAIAIALRPNLDPEDTRP